MANLGSARTLLQCVRATAAPLLLLALCGLACIATTNATAGDVGSANHTSHTLPWNESSNNLSRDDQAILRRTGQLTNHSDLLTELDSRWSTFPVAPGGVPAATPGASGEGADASTSPLMVGDLIAVGDVHGCSDCLLSTLMANGVVDEHGKWVAGNRTVVQLGDLIGRGTDDRGVLEHVQRLTAEAAASGGKWVQLLGNHEWMELEGNFEYANDDGAQTGFGSTAARAAAFGPGGSHGDFLRSLPIVYQWEGVVFVHGGISQLELAQFGTRTLNRFSKMPEYRGKVCDHLLWDRTLTLGPEADVCPMLDKVLNALGADTMVVGHTITSMAGYTPGELAERCGGKLRLTDVGMSDAFDEIPKYNRATHFFSSLRANAILAK